MILGTTGHRSSKCGGFSIPNPTYNYIVREIKKQFSILKPSTVITGMAIGADQYVAKICIEENIPFIAAVPFLGQELYWPTDARKLYFDLLSHADHVEYVSSGGFASWKMQVRNQWIVDKSDMLLAVFRTSSSHGGTYNCISYAKEKNKEIVIIDPDVISH